MAVYNVNGSDEEYSDMDGLGTPFNDGDSWTVINGSITADQNGKAGAICTVNDAGVFYVNPNVNALFNSGGNHTLSINEGGRVCGEGTVGNHAVIGGDAGTDASRILINAGGFLYTEYTTLQYFSFARTLAITSGGRIHLKNTTISHTGTTSIDVGHAFAELEDCTWTDSNATECFQVSSGTVILKNTTMLASTRWLESTTYSRVFIIGNTTIDIGGGAVEPNNTNDLGTFVEDYRYYPSSTDNETNSEQDAGLSLTHDSLNVDGKLVDSTNKMEYDGYLSYPLTDAGGDIVTYKLKKVYFDGVWKYWSDSGQAEAGDNQKWTGTLSKDTFTTESDTEWAGTNMSFTLGPAGGRRPRARRHGI